MYDVTVNIYVNGTVKNILHRSLSDQTISKIEHGPRNSWREGEFASSQAFCFQKACFTSAARKNLHIFHKLF